MDEKDLNNQYNSRYDNLDKNINNKTNISKQDYSFNNNNNYYSTSNINYNIYDIQKPNLKNVNDFIFLGDELHLYREIPRLGNFYSYKNKSVKGIFLDKTICMMNQDQFYAKIINKYGDKELLYIPNIPATNPYYIYVKHLFDFYDACFNPEALQNNSKKKMELEKQIDERINKIDLFNNIFYNKSKEDNYSKQYYMDNNPTVLDVQNLLRRNQKALDNIEQIRYQNQNES